VHICDTEPAKHYNFITTMIIIFDAFGNENHFRFAFLSTLMIWSIWFSVARSRFF